MYGKSVPISFSKGSSTEDFHPINRLFLLGGQGASPESIKVVKSRMSILIKISMRIYLIRRMKSETTKVCIKHVNFRLENFIGKEYTVDMGL